MNRIAENSKAMLSGLWDQLPTAPLIALLALEADQISKLWIRESLVLGESVSHEGVLRITRIANSGVIFGAPAPLAVSLVLPLLVIGMCLFLYRRYVLSNSMLLNVATGLFIGGSLGNLVERIAFGHVTDFIEVISSGGLVRTTFNVADLCIILGIILLEIFFVRLLLKKIPRHGHLIPYLLKMRRGPKDSP
ncbi:MAG: signal peptidase II [Chloroflexi bacterium]|nr:signal peptidase II [Chloroflexota bacterium]